MSGGGGDELAPYGKGNDQLWAAQTGETWRRWSAATFSLVLGLTTTSAVYVGQPQLASLMIMIIINKVVYLCGAPPPPTLRLAIASLAPLRRLRLPSPRFGTNH